MALRPVFNDCTREYLTENKNVEFPLSEWVSIEFPFQQVKTLDKELELEDYEANDTVEYETNRYDVHYRDDAKGKTLSVYLYMNEDSNQVIAIDGTVKDVEKEDVFYPIEETPFADILQDIRNK